MKNRRKLPHPFIGHSGIGSAIELVQVDTNWVLRETPLSQLKTIFTLAVVGFVPAAILVFQSGKIRGGFLGVGYCILLGSALLGIGFFFKYLFRFARRRRLEFDRNAQRLLMITHGEMAERSISFSFIRHLVFQEAVLARKNRRTSLMISAVMDDGSIVELAASSGRGDQKALREKLSQILPVQG